MITAEFLRRIGVKPEWLDPLTAAADGYGISLADEREAMWVAQCAHESQGFTVLVENLNYSPQGLLAVFGRRFTPAEAVDYAHDGERIANRAYGGRNGNGDEASGDGWRFRGRGLLQITGRGNYGRCAAAIGEDLLAHPEMLERPMFAAKSAAWYWMSNGLNQLADEGAFAAITRRINGPAMDGQHERERWLAKIQQVMHGG